MIILLMFPYNGFFHLSRYFHDFQLFSKTVLFHSLQLKSFIIPTSQHAFLLDLVSLVQNYIRTYSQRPLTLKRVTIFILFYFITEIYTSKINVSSPFSNSTGTILNSFLSKCFEDSVSRRWGRSRTRPVDSYLRRGRLLEWKLDSSSKKTYRMSPSTSVTLLIFCLLLPRLRGVTSINNSCLFLFVEMDFVLISFMWWGLDSGGGIP